MVFIESMSTYLAEFEKDNEVHLFIKFLQGESIIDDGEHFDDENQLIYYSSLRFLQNLDSDFLKRYSNFEKRVPTVQSPWIYNDFLVFSLICVIKKKTYDSEWIKEVVNKRKPTDIEGETIKNSFLCLIDNDFLSLKLNTAILLVFKKILEINIDSTDNVNDIFRKSLYSKFPYFENNFLNIITINSLEIIFEKKGLINQDEYQLLYSFSQKFDNRVRQTSFSLWLIIALSFLGIGIYLSYLVYNKSFYGSQENINFIGKIANIVQIIGWVPLSTAGFGLLGITGRKMITQFFSYLINYFWGRR